MTQNIPSADDNQPDWFTFAKAMAIAVMFQRGTRGVHVIGRDGRAKAGCVDLLGCYAVDEMAEAFCNAAGIEFDSINPPTEHEAMFMLLAGMTWQDWLDNPRQIRAEARGNGHPAKVDLRVLAQAIEARRAETGTGSVHESAVAEGDAP